MTTEEELHTKRWVDKLSSVELPALAGVIKELNAVSQSDDSSAAQLAEIILRDSALTTKVLRIANSAYHRAGSQNEISTISRAVVQLGFRGVKAISLSVMMLDSLLKRHPKDRLLEWLARGFHAGMQAEGLIKQVDTQQSEEAFTTAFLLHVGELAFWSCNNAQTELLEQRLPAHSTGNDDTERDALGASLKDIGRALAREWHLGDDLIDALSPGHKSRPLIQAVLLAEEISFAAEQGWQSQAATDALVKASLFTGLSLDESRKLVLSSADRAATMAVSYGANRLCQLIPSSEGRSAPTGKQYMEPDAQLQLNVLREMAELVQQRANVNSLFQMLVEGLHRGVALERVGLCLIAPKVTAMVAKYILGEGTEEWRSDFTFPLVKEQDNLFAYAVHRRENIYLQRNKRHNLHAFINKKMERLLDVENCLIIPLYAGQRPVGVLIADRSRGGPAISQDQFDSAAHMAYQASTALALLANKR